MVCTIPFLQLSSKRKCYNSIHAKRLKKIVSNQKQALRIILQTAVEPGLKFGHIIDKVKYTSNVPEQSCFIETKFSLKATKFAASPREPRLWNKLADEKTTKALTSAYLFQQRFKDQLKDCKMKLFFSTLFNL